MMIDIETVPIETVTPIKHSEAIRLGCLLAPIQAFGHYGTGRRACALGAMALGFGRFYKAASGNIYGLDPLDEPDLSGITCPACYYSPLIYAPPIIPHLNDVHKWTREQIADWLESVGF